MVAKKTSTKTKSSQPDKQITSATAAGENAEVSATGAGQPAPQAATESATPATPIVKTKETPPVGENADARPDPAKNAPAARTLIVSAKAEGFRRAGRAWSKNAESVSAADFSDEQIEALLAEPMLDVTEVGG